MFLCITSCKKGKVEFNTPAFLITIILKIRYLDPLTTLVEWIYESAFIHIFKMFRSYYRKVWNSKWSEIIMTGGYVF